MPLTAPFLQQRKSEWERYRRRIRVLPAALGYALRGWSVLPCKSGKKEPLTPHGYKDATTDQASIRSFWDTWPTANVAIVTGKASELLVVDVDPRNGGTEQLAVFEERYGALPADHVVETSEGGRHFYLRQPYGVSVPCSQLAPGIDIKCDGGYVLAPPSIHPSGHRYRLECGGDVPPVPDWLIVALQQKARAQAHGQRGKDGAAISVEDLHVSDDIKRLIREGVPKGQRSNKSFSVLKAMVMNGHTDDEIIAVMMNQENGISEKPREKGLEWLRRDIYAARNKPGRAANEDSHDDGSTSSEGNQEGDHFGKQKADTEGASSTAGPSKQTTGSKAGFKLLSVDDLKRMEPPLWLLDGMLVAGSFAVLYGPSGVGKSFLALDISLSIATDVVGVAEPIGCGPVVYVAAEGAGGLTNRVHAWEKAHDHDAANIHFLPEAVKLIDKGDTEALIASIRGQGIVPKLIVIDTMARCLSGGDENSAKDVGQFVTMIDVVRAAFECAVLIVHHGTKSDAETERGSSALRGAADTMLFLGSRHGALTLSCKKQKEGPEFESISLRLEPVELASGETSCVVRSDGVGATSPGTSPNDHGKAILEILAVVGESTYSELKEKFISDTNRSKRTFDRALEKLMAAEAIKKTKAGKYVLA